MRLPSFRQSIWMYGFPTRKHHYTERALAKKHSVAEKYAELKFVEHHPNPSSPYKSSSVVNYYGNKNVSSSVKNSDRHDINDALPVLPKCQVHNKNGIVPVSSSVAGRYVTFEDELPPGHNVDYYGNITGWHRYETPNRDADHFTYPSAHVPNISRWTNETFTNAHPPLIRSPTRYPNSPYVEPSPPSSPSPINTPLAFTKARFEWPKRDVPSRTAYAEVANACCSSVKLVCDDSSTGHRPVETLLLKAVKLEDSTILAGLLNSDLYENVNADDVSGRTVLSYLVMKNNVILLEKLLQAPELDVNKSDNEGNTPLHFSAQAGQVESLSLLLNCCSAIDVDARNIFGFTPLMKAALQGRTKCAKLLLFAGASPTMRDTGKGLRAEQWARYCGRYICADVIEKYARNQLLSKTASYGNWGAEPEVGLHFVHGRLQPPAIALRNAINQSYKDNSIKSRLKKAFQHTNPSNWNNNPKVNSYSLVTQLTSAALCVSSPVLPNSSKVTPVVKSLIKPFVIPRVEITPDPDVSPEHSVKPTDSNNTSKTDQNEQIAKRGRKLSCFVRLRRKSHF